MPTFPEIQRNVRAYKSAIARAPSLPAQLEWFCHQLGIDKRRFLRLLGYTPTEIREAQMKSVEELAAAKPDQSLWVAELFKELADRAGYDMKHLAEILHSRPVEAPEAGRENRPAGYIPRLRYGPEDRRVVLLEEIARGGPQVFDRLVEYLRVPAEGETPLPDHPD